MWRFGEVLAPGGSSAEYAHMKLANLLAAVGDMAGGRCKGGLVPGLRGFLCSR